jgi:anti-sigma regulatory factor (Ser/Thr protein kinase)
MNNTRALTRPTAPRKLRITLTAEHAAEAARNEVRAAIRAWDVPVDPAVAVLLTRELMANALRHEAGGAIELVVSCALGQLQVDVYDTSPAMALPVDAPADSPTGAGLMLLASLSTSWGYHRTPTGRAGFFTLMF